MQSEEPSMYRFAMKSTLALSALSLIMLILHYTVGILSERTTQIMAVGVFFYLLMYFGYKKDFDERRQEEEEALPSRRRDEEKK